LVDFGWKGKADIQAKSNRRSIKPSSKGTQRKRGDGAKRKEALKETSMAQREGPVLIYLVARWRSNTLSGRVM